MRAPRRRTFKTPLGCPPRAPWIWGGGRESGGASACSGCQPLGWAGHPSAPRTLSGRHARRCTHHRTGTCHGAATSSTPRPSCSCLFPGAGWASHSTSGGHPFADLSPSARSIRIYLATPPGLCLSGNPHSEPCWASSLRKPERRWGGLGVGSCTVCRSDTCPAGKRHTRTVSYPEAVLAHLVSLGWVAGTEHLPAVTAGPVGMRGPKHPGWNECVPPSGVPARERTKTGTSQCHRRGGALRISRTAKLQIR